MLDLPPNAEAARLLDRMGAMPADRDETLAVRPDPHKHPELWRHLERCHRDMISQMGSGLTGNGYRGFPAFPVDAGPVALHLYVWLYLAVLPRTLRYHAERGIERHRSWETLSGLGPMMAEHRSVHGVGGVGAFDQWCPPLRFRGTEYLPERSNIVRFQRRFVLKPPAPGDEDRADASMLEYVFGRPSRQGPVTESRLAELPQDTTLRRAYVTHLRSGRHWHARTGRIVYGVSF
ncbi:hypothetical protein FE391_28805 [Nonomuraea sp. KC401]|uniref:acyltransferase domain-containing protein n=1 Tax=unclassified Nonomuraea TaxID=2593643 RepID=UPI0010FE3564|nr:MULTISPECIES: acyltransferase domain-containing protein [unclassified Nonomuraea]NBE97741.1 hypothetical protein [Nonomuraea sp. K271]TLF63194.1 hypothetical protein FE391_28805 [Nonomuraea sp. KC401]